MEVVSIMELLFDQDVVTKNYEAELYRDGMKAMLDKLVKNGAITKSRLKMLLKKNRVKKFINLVSVRNSMQLNNTNIIC